MIILSVSLPIILHPLHQRDGIGIIRVVASPIVHALGGVVDIADDFSAGQDGTEQADWRQHQQSYECEERNQVPLKEGRGGIFRLAGVEQRCRGADGN